MKNRSKDKYSIVVLGSGPGGYVAAIRAAQLGYSVAIIEKYPVLGGTCTNVGCIPSKALLDSSKNFYKAKNNFRHHGIVHDEPRLSFRSFMERKRKVVETNTKGLKHLMRKNNIKVYEGFGSFEDNTTIKVSSSKTGEQYIKADHIIIATGSRPATVPGVLVDNNRIITSTGALDLNERPDSLIVVGGGAIGVEIASIFARIGTTVTVLESMDRLTPNMDVDVSKELKRALRKLGITIKTNARVNKTTVGEDSVSIQYTVKDENLNLSSEKVLVATGRRPYTHRLGLQNVGIETDDKGFIPVDDMLRTAQKNIWAIGDVIGGNMLAHKAEEEGVAVVERIDGQKPHINYDLIPNIVYTWPEAATLGYTEQQLKREGMSYRIGKFPVSASARGRAAGESEGMAKVISKPNGKILGVHIVAPRASDLISQAVVAMEFMASDEDMTLTSYAHPTYSEILKEAYLAASQKGSINS